MLSPYVPVLMAMVVGFGLLGVVTSLSLLVGPKNPNPAKLDVYECGVPVVGTARTRLSVKFYLVAILFILFDIESIFMYLWGVAFNFLGWFGVIEIAIFVGILLLGYIYILKRGALSWD